jgi:TRAP-type C4-dicarboxylate transport system substrate-binding protein
MRRRRSVMVALAACAALPIALTACASPAATSSSGEETITLRTNDWNPPAHPFNANGWEPMAEAISEASGGAVQLENYPSEGLGAVADTLTLLESGAADMASTTVAYHPAELPLLQVTAGMAWDDAALGAQAMWEMCQQEPFKSEIEAAGIVPIVCTSVSPYELLTAGSDITGVPEAFEGKKLRATGLQGKIVQALGATPTSDASTEIYLRMEQGSIDGTTAGWYTLPALSLDEVTTNATVGMANWNAGMVIFAMSTDGWNALSDENKEILREVGREYSLTVAQGIDAQDDEAKEAAEGDVEIYEVSSKERAEVRTVVDEVLKTWISEMGSTRDLGDEAQAAFDVLKSLEDIEPLPVDEWTPSSY